MEWITSLKQAIEYMEEHLFDNIGADDVADAVHMSPFYLQKSFQIITRYSLGEYIRNRRLYLAALDMVSGDRKIIDIALQYGYETPESFTKAFSHFHGITPTQTRKSKDAIRTFLPLTISITVQGGTKMDYSVEKMNRFKIIGYQREFEYDTAYAEIPKFWDEITSQKIFPLSGKSALETPEEKTIRDCRIGEFDVCIDDIGKEGKFRYLIAGTYTDGNIPEGMTVYGFP